MQTTHTTQQLKTHYSVEKWAVVVNRHFAKEDRQMPSRHIKKMLNIINIKEMHIKTKVRYYLTPIPQKTKNRITI